MCDQVAKFLPQLVEVVKVLRGVGKEIIEINGELESIKIFINHEDRMTTTAEQDDLDENAMKRKVKRMREVAFRIEEVVEDYRITQQHHPSYGLGCEAILYATTIFIKTMTLRLQIPFEIQDIKSSIREIKERPSLQTQSCFEKGSSSGSQNVPPQHALRSDDLYVEEDDVVGFQISRDNLIGLLNEEREERTVIAVVGMGGGGKTTLANIVYERVKMDFACHAWVKVPREYTIEGLLRTMLKRFGEKGKEVIEMDLELLTEKVKSYMQKKRYVVFFDDIWKEEILTKIQTIMLDIKNRSRIVITTRNKNIANSCNKFAYVHIYEMQPLSHDQSFRLLMKKAFRNERDGLCPIGFEGISSEIVEKCQGLPLAIVAIGGLLACTEKNVCEWKMLCGHLIELDKNPNSTSLTNILGLSYNALPYHLKACFLYFGIYPKGYEVESNRLIRQWMAEGFIKKSNSRQTLEEIAQQYLKELIHRSLVQASSYSVRGKPKKCRVHELLHDMVRTKIANIGFCHFACDDGNDGRSVNSEKIRRLQIGIDSNVDYFENAFNEGSLIRTLHVFISEELNEDLLKIIPTRCMRLKVIDFQDNPLNYIPPNLGHLICPRYLSFRNTSIKSLPKSISLLQNLETLDLMGTFLDLLPIEINHLQKLRHLLIHWSRMMGGFGGLKSLQTLSHVKTDSWEEDEFKELEKLRKLRSLGLTEVNPKYVTTLCCSMNKMQHLEKLIVISTENAVWDSVSFPKLQKLRLGGKLEKFQTWIIEHTNLVKLSSVDSNLNDDPMNSLMQLPNLASLGLLKNAYVGTTLDFRSGGFQNLRKLLLGCLVNLNLIHIGEGALPSLKKIELYDIPQLKEVPSGINNLGNLKVFYIDSMHKDFEDSYQKIYGSRTMSADC